LTVTTWNPSDKSANVTLSGSNLVATSTGAGAVRSIGNSYSTGLIYFEIDVTAQTSDLSIGIANAAETLSNAEQLGSTTNSVGCYTEFNDGELFLNNSALIGGGGASGSILGVHAFAFDFTASPPEVWWSAPNFRASSVPWNKSGTANPSTLTGGVVLTGISAGPYMIAFGTDASGGSVTLATGSGGFSLAVPSGFTGWDAELLNETATMFMGM